MGAGYPFLWLAIATDVGAMIAVTINSSTLLGRKKKVVGGMKGTSSHDHDGADVCQRKPIKEGCQDGCCETKEVVADCADGCCGAKPKDVVKEQEHGHGHGHGSTKPAPKSECAKGCCSTESKSAPAPKKECAKGCCSTTTVTKAPSSSFAFVVTDASGGDMNTTLKALELLDGVVS